MLPNGSYAIGVPQIATLIGTSKNTASRDFKRLLGKGFRPSKVSTELGNQKINVVPLESFTAILYAAAKNGNKQADALMQALLSESIDRRFDRAFGQRVSEDERNRRLYERITSRRDFRPLTDQLKIHGFSDPKDYGRYVAAFQRRCGIKPGGRDGADAETLSRLNVTQTRLTTLMECGLSPWEALRRL